MIGGGVFYASAVERRILFVLRCFTGGVCARGLRFLGVSLGFTKWSGCLEVGAPGGGFPFGLRELGHVGPLRAW